MMAKDAGATRPTEAGPAGVVESTRAADQRSSDPLDPDVDALHLPLQTRTAGSIPPPASLRRLRLLAQLGRLQDDLPLRRRRRRRQQPTGRPPTRRTRPSTRAYYSAAPARPLDRRRATRSRPATRPASTSSTATRTRSVRSCGRSELTFSRGGGGFIANKSGPGPRDPLLHRRQQRHLHPAGPTSTTSAAEVTYTYLRVHPGISDDQPVPRLLAGRDGDDLPKLRRPGRRDDRRRPRPGARDRDNLGPALTWEQVTGAQGTALDRQSRTRPTSAVSTVGSFYQDDSTSPATAPVRRLRRRLRPGARAGPTISMPSVTGGINTDPTLGHRLLDFAGTRTIFFSGTGGDAALARALRSATRSTTRWPATALHARTEPDPPGPEARRSQGQKRYAGAGRQRTRSRVSRSEPRAPPPRTGSRSAPKAPKTTSADRAAARSTDGLLRRQAVRDQPQGHRSRRPAARTLVEGRAYKATAVQRRAQTRSRRSTTDQALRPTGRRSTRGAAPSRRSRAPRRASPRRRPSRCATSRTVRSELAASLTISAAVS